MRSRNFSVKPALAKSVTEKNARLSPPIYPRPIPRSRKELKAPENCQPEVQIDFTELENGSLIEVVEDPADSDHTLFAVSKQGRVRLAERVQDRGRILVPTPRNASGFSDVKLPRGVMPYKSVMRLVHYVMQVIRCAVDVPDEYAALLSAFADRCVLVRHRTPAIRQKYAAGNTEFTVPTSTTCERYQSGGGLSGLQQFQSDPAHR
jgi:hypothetical protein